MTQKSIFEGQIATQLDFTEIATKILDKIPIHYDTSQIWYLWNNTQNCWEIKDEIDILNNISTEFTIANITKNNIKHELLNALKMIARRNKPKELTKEEIQFNNKIININTKEIKNASPEYFTFNPIPHNIGKSKETPTIDKFLTEWVGKKNKELLKQWIAYNMLPSYPISRVMCFNGNGRNGKTTTIELMSKIIGEKNITSGEFEDIFEGRFGTGKLYRKTSCFMGETNFFKIQKTGKFKSATGRDKISIEHKNKQPFSYENYAKITISTNTLPVTSDTSDGFYRRWNIIDFPNQYEEKVNILQQIPNVEFENFCAYAIETLKILLEKGKFDNEGSIEERKEKYEKTSNPLKIFIDEHMIENPDEYITKKEFNDSLNKWLKENKCRIMTDIEISKTMKKVMNYSENWRKNTDGTWSRVWTGIKPKSLNTERYNTTP